ncbi:phosphatidate cytidylyltransferase [Thalassovita aquimarina]|uniref:Phosphatidate cytidylyltransferase n=1 Tax=Thalassovita aquimarina TaxID=2785917 RepID=A0ABS5HSB4_9RHOB|nr:phosphatidate cytidylyltransferase [Thalassovita aquimarina]MBR9651852.1 phosphatidate cytidylyltransferase [Thalassovita aquimarina]
MSGSSKWQDLAPRVGSALVLVAVGGWAAWMGGTVFLVLIAALTGVMIWELMRMLAPENGAARVWMGLLCAAVMAATAYLPAQALLPALLAPVLVGISSVRNHRGIWLGYASLVMLGAFGALSLRATGITWVIWLVAVVAASDIAGYFAGRLLGGPKFWPRVSPKKTWSGTVAGWIAAGLVGFLFMANGSAGIGIVVISVIMAFAGQLGDVAESAVKRRVGVKDASNLIPGHGGFLDRFDAMLGALLLVLIVQALTDFLPVAG